MKVVYILSGFYTTIEVAENAPPCLLIEQNKTKNTRIRET